MQYSLQLLPTYIAYPSIYTYKIGLNMGKPMGRHPIPVTYSQIPKRTQKKGWDPTISASSCIPYSTSCRSPKMVKYDQVFLKTWSRANRPPTLTCDSFRVTLVWSVPLRMSRAWTELLWPIVVQHPLSQWTSESLCCLLVLPCAIMWWWQLVQAWLPGSQI